MQERGYIHQITHPAELDEAADQGVIDRLHRLRRHRAASLHVGQPDPDHDAAPAAAGRPQADRPDGRRHHQGRRPHRQGRASARCSPTSRSRPTSPRSRRVFAQVPDLRRRPDRRDHGRQRRVAVEARLRRSSCATTASTSPSTACWPSTASRLRLEREQPMTFLEFNYMLMQSVDFLELDAQARLRAADGRLGPVGQHRQRGGADPPRRPEAAVRPDHAAALHRLGPEDGQDGRRGRAG